MVQNLLKKQNRSLQKITRAQAMKKKAPGVKCLQQERHKVLWHRWRNISLRETRRRTGFFYSPGIHL